MSLHLARRGNPSYIGGYDVAAGLITSLYDSGLIITARENIDKVTWREFDFWYDYTKEPRVHL